MSNAEAAKILVSMIAVLSRGGLMEKSYSEAVAIACAALYREQEES